MQLISKNQGNTKEPMVEIVAIRETESEIVTVVDQHFERKEKRKEKRKEERKEGRRKGRSITYRK